MVPNYGSRDHGILDNLIVSGSKNVVIYRTAKHSIASDCYRISSTSGSPRNGGSFCFHCLIYFERQVSNYVVVFGILFNVHCKQLAGYIYGHMTGSWTAIFRRRNNCLAVNEFTEELIILKDTAKIRRIGYPVIRYRKSWP